MDKPLLYVLDTHVLIWYFIGSKRLTAEVKERIDGTLREGGCLLVPTIVLAEALYVAEKGRVSFDFSAMYRLIRVDPGFEIVDFGIEIFDEMLQIETVKEIHDRLIVATARFYGAGILTKDPVIRHSTEVKT